MLLFIRRHDTSHLKEDSFAGAKLMKGTSSLDNEKETKYSSTVTSSTLGNRSPQKILLLVVCSFHTARIKCETSAGVFSSKVYVYKKPRDKKKSLPLGTEQKRS
jgi:hypothetical protein